MTRTIQYGHYPETFHASTAGGWGCDPCDYCGRPVAKGEPVWLNCYSDLICQDCADRWTVPAPTFETVADLIQTALIS